MFVCVFDCVFVRWSDILLDCAFVRLFICLFDGVVVRLMFLCDCVFGRVFDGLNDYGCMFV